MKLRVLYEDNHLLAVDKPVGLATMGLPEGEPTLLALAKDYIRQRYSKPGNVYLGVVSRLDVPVSGVVLLARTSKAASRLSRQFREHTCRKRYWTVVEGVPGETEAELRHWLVADSRHRRVHVVNALAADASEAVLRYALWRAGTGWSLLEIDLLTGRKHQIRAQLAAIGHPVVGDRKYGSRRPFGSGIALHARSLIVEHPTRKEPLQLEALPPPSWQEFAPWPED